nr:MFS transporter [Kitasatospora sp. NA04385]
MHGNWTSGLYWNVTAPWFAMAFAALLLPGGHLADLVGRRRALAVGLTGFAAVGLLDLFGPVLDEDGPLRLAAALLQGGFGALALTASLVVTATAPRDHAERAGAFGVYAAVTVAGTVAGLLDAELLSSKNVLLVGAVAALAALLGVRTLPPDSRERARARFSPLGTLLGALGPAAFVFGAGQRWASPAMLVPSAAGLVLLALFWWQQRAGHHPILPPDVRHGRDRIGALLVAALTGAGFLCLLPMLTWMVYRGDDQSVVGTTGPLVLLAAGALVGAAVARARLPRPGASPRVLAVTGLLATVAGVAGGVLALDRGDAGPLLSAGTTVAGLGIGLALVPVFFCAATTIVPRLAGAAAGALATAQFAGQGLGASVLYGNADTPPWWAAACLLLAAPLAGATLPRGLPTAPRH